MMETWREKVRERERATEGSIEIIMMKKKMVKVSVENVRQSVRKDRSMVHDTSPTHPKTNLGCHAIDFFHG